MSPNPNDRYQSDFDYYDDFENNAFEDLDDSDDAIGRFLERRMNTNSEHSRGGYSPDLNERLEYYAGNRYENTYDDKVYRQADSARHLLADERSYEQPKPSSLRSSRTSAAPATPRPAAANRTADDKKSFSLKRTIGSLAVLALCLIAVYYGMIIALTGDINRVKIDNSSDVVPTESVADIEVVSSTASVKNVLLIGIDDDGSEGSRSDTIMIASIDTRSRTIRLCSILRDNYVPIPGHNDNRINASFAFGGAELLLQTIEKNFRIDIDDYISVDMDAMISLVDAVGGVTINLTDKEAYQVNRYSNSESPAVSAGEQRLDGKQAVYYARIRKIDSDFGRTNRQRTLINAIIAECRKLPPTELFSLVSTVSPYLTTNMSSVKIASLGLMVLPAMANDMEQLSIPVEGSFKSARIKQMAVLVPDLPANAAALREFLYGADE